MVQSKEPGYLYHAKEDDRLKEKAKKQEEKEEKDDLDFYGKSSET
jgi:hypothetical protein